MTVRNLIQKHGGIAAVARSTSIPPQTISNWMLNNSIPVKRWPALIDVGFDSAELLEIHRIAPPLRAAE